MGEYEIIMVRGVVCQFTAEATDALLKTGAIYWCDEHDAYHLTPDREFTVEEAEILVLAEL